MLFPEIPEDFAELSAEELAAFIEASTEAIRAVTADPASFVNEELSSAELLEAARATTAALQAARAELATREEEAAEEDDPEDEPAAEELSADELAAEMATLASEVDEAPEPEPVEPEPAPEPPVPAEPESVVASVPARRRKLPAPTRERQPLRQQEERVALTAAAGAHGFEPGQEFPSLDSIAQAMIARRRQFGLIPDGTEGENIPIVRADWSHLYPDERKLTGDVIENMELVASVTNDSAIKGYMRQRRDSSLTASGGLCAPVTPYYQLQMISQANRPVRAGLAAFNADRGGIRFARPAALTSIGTAIGTKTVAQDAGTDFHKTCQVIDCPPFSEVDVRTIYHCLLFGNLGARVFPELLTQWTQLTLAAHARLAESWLLTGIDTASTQVTAQNLGLGATASLLGQVLAAANGMRNRHRMDPEAVLRLMMPDWAIDLLISDTIRSQFERFDTDEAKITALLRSFDIEPSFYIDSATGRGQVFGAQGAGALLPFPPNVVWYLFPEGSFLYVDGGTLELGLVRDSVLNLTNDFQLFGETFENVAFVGVESLAVSSTICDSGMTAGTRTVPCPIDYTHTS